MKNSVNVRDYMVNRPVLATPDTELFEAIHDIVRYKLSGLTVVDDRHHPIGMLSELDCLRAILSGTYHQDTVGSMRVGDNMSVNVQCVDSQADIIDVARSMLDHKHRRRPVIDDDGRLVGQVTCRAILKGIKDFDVPKRWFEGN